MSVLAILAGVLIGVGSLYVSATAGLAMNDRAPHEARDMLFVAFGLLAVALCLVAWGASA